MGFLKKLFDTLFGSSEGEIHDPDGIYLYVKCNRCGAPVRVRADRRHDLQRDYDTNEYILRKEIMDGTCFSMMQATVRFGPDYRIIDQQIEGGEFITWEEYKELTTSSGDVESDAEPDAPSESP